jgi:hypothetical protein
MKTDENVGKVRTLVRTDRRLGTRVIEEELNMDKGTVRRTSTADLNTEKLCPKVVTRNPPVFATEQISTLGHRPYSPDLATAIFLFSQN